MKKIFFIFSATVIMLSHLNLAQAHHNEPHTLPSQSGKKIIRTIKKIEHKTGSSIKKTANKTKSITKSAVDGVKNNVELELGNKETDEYGVTYYDHDDDLDE